MSRPVPHAKFLTELAVQVQTKLRRQVHGPVLLSARPESDYALITASYDQAIQVMDRQEEKILRKLEVPEGTRRATDFLFYEYSPDGKKVAAWDAHQQAFAAWSLNDGKLLLHCHTSGKAGPAITFLPGEKIAVASGPQIHVYELGGKKVSATTLADTLRSLVLYAPSMQQEKLIALGVFRKGLGGSHLTCFRIEDGEIAAMHEGPDRERPQNPDDSQFVSLHELLKIPGSTAHLLIGCEENCLAHRVSSASWDYDHKYTTRLLAVDPELGRFHKSELSLPGRHCLEPREGDLYLIDETGRQRRVCGFPLRLEEADWRLTG